MVKMTPHQLDCAEPVLCCGKAKKSSPASAAITTPPLSQGATGHVTRVTKEIVKTLAKKVVEKVVMGQAACESKGVIKQVGFHLRTLQLCPRMRLLLTGGFLKPSLSGSFGPYEGINQGFTWPSSDTLTTSQTSSRQKTKCTAGITSSGQRLFYLF